MAEPMIRIALLGDSRVGKTILRYVYVHQHWPEDWLDPARYEYDAHLVVGNTNVTIAFDDLPGNSVNILSQSLSPPID